ncbi:MAG: M56 family metallopeptidase [Nitrospirota bacterium]
MWLLNSLIGIYVVQTFLHSLIAILVIERAIEIWGIKNPLAQFRYRLMTLILPISMFPLYNLINLNRNSLLFREEKALFNFNRWLAIEIWDIVPVSTIFMLFLLITSVIFFFQEIIPIIKDSLPRERENNRLLTVDREIDSMVAELSESLGIEKPPVKIIYDKNAVILTAGARNHTIIFSSGLVSMLDKEQLHSAIAHELAHIVRRSNATTWAIFILRILMFFNPIVLVVFRRIVQDDEHICDDITVSLTRKPSALASTLKVFYSSQYEGKPSFLGKITAMKEGIENHSHNLLLKERIARLESAEISGDRDFEWGKFILTISVLILINYFVV